MSKICICFLLIISFAVPSAVLAEAPRDYDGWSLTETTRKCEAIYENVDTGVSGHAVIDSSPPSDSFSYSISIDKISPLRDMGERPPAMQVRASLTSGEVFELPNFSASYTGERRFISITPARYDRGYLSAITGKIVGIEVRVDQTYSRNPDPSAPYKKIFSVNNPSFSELVPALEACKARVRSNNQPLLIKDLTDKQSFCPFYTYSERNVERVKFDIPSGIYRLLVDKTGRVEEVQPPLSHNMPEVSLTSGADKDRFLSRALKEIGSDLRRRLRFKPAFDSQYEPKASWIEYHWPVISCS